VQKQGQVGRWAGGQIGSEVLGKRGVQGRGPTARLVQHPGRRRTVLLKISPHSSFPRRRESIVPTMGPRFRRDDVDFQNRENKARMFMKTKEEYKKSGSLVAQTAGSAVCGFSMVAGLAADRKYGGPRYQNRRNKARMFMKTKEEYKKSGSRDGEKPLTRLATLANLSPRERAFGLVRLQRSRERGETRVNTEFVGTNSISPLAPVKASRNELKTNSISSAKCANPASIHELRGATERNPSPGSLLSSPFPQARGPLLSLYTGVVGTNLGSH